MGEWISVEDRLPTEDGDYLVMKKPYSGETLVADVMGFSKNLAEVDKYDFPDCRRSGWYFYDGEYSALVESKRVTHWMQLPPPPET